MVKALMESGHESLDPNGTSPVDHLYSRAYVRHLFHANELLALYIGSVHNLTFYLDLVREAEPKFKPEPSGGRITWWFNWRSVFES